MGWLNSWASGVIVAILSATILEMLLPEGNNKKYIKVIIGIYVLFTIMSPVVSGLLDKDVDIEEIFKNTNEFSIPEVEINSNKMILDTYISNLKEDIKQKLLNKGYSADEIKIEVGETDNNYGKIQRMEIIISSTEQENQIKEIEKIEVNISKQPEEKVKIQSEEIKVLKKYLAESYEIEEDSIIIV